MKRLLLLLLAGLSFLGFVFSGTLAYAAAGSLDPTFGSGGVSTITIPGNNNGVVVNAAVLQPDGKIVVQGSFGVARVLPSGAIDTTFGAGGFAQTPVSYFFGAVGLQSDGKILVAGVGNGQNGGAGFGVTRLNANGSLDTSFGGTGTVVVVTLGSLPNISEAVLQQADGKILLGGALIGRPYHTVLIRFNLDGSLDSSFGSGGVVNVPSIFGVTQLALDLHGDIFVINGQLIAEFSTNGTLLPQVIPAPLVRSSHGGSTVFLANGEYVDAETVYVGTPRNRDLDGHVVRFTATGGIDPSFNSPTFDFVGEGGTDQFDTLHGVAIQTDGEVVVGGGDAAGQGLARFNTNGSFDSTFGNGGIVTTNIAALASAVIIQSDGKIVTAGVENNTALVLARYLAQ